MIVAISFTVVGVPMLFPPGAYSEEPDVIAVVSGPESLADETPPTTVAAPPPTTVAAPLSTEAPATSSTDATATTSTTEATATTSTTEAPPVIQVPTTTSTTEAPAVTTTEPPPAPPPTTTTTAAPPTTTTTAPPPPPPPPPPPAPSANVQEGTSSWYDLPGARAGICAHRTLDFGTVLTVTHVGTGESITCTVGDRGPFAGGFILDLFREDFVRLAPLSVGVIPVRLTW